MATPTPVLSPKRRIDTALRCADALPLAVLCVVTGIAVWNRLAFDSWLARFDIFTQYLPWFHYLGERIRQGAVPAWNPFQFSGTPFAGDPQSGWMYLPAMAAFALLPALAAFKAMVAFQLAIAAFATYGLARALGLGAWAALVAAVAYVCGPLLQWNTYCCLVMGQFATWTPVALLGLELGLRAGSWQRRLLAWTLAGFALSQLFAAWVGEGWFDALLIIAGFALFRLLAPAGTHAARHWPQWFVMVGANVGAVIGIGFALGAAAMLPRLAANRESNLAGGNYAGLGRSGGDNPPWSPSTLVAHLLRTGYADRTLALGGAVVVLALLGLLLGWHRGAVPFFAVLTAVSLVLPLETTPLHRLFYVIPHLKTLHEHDPWRSVALGTLGPPMLAGAGVDSLGERFSGRRCALVALPMAVVAAAAWLLDATSGVFVGWGVLAAGAFATAIVVIAIRPRQGGNRREARLVPALLLAAVLIQPVGLEWSGSWFGWPADRSWSSRWHPPSAVANAVAAQITSTDAQGVGAFLRARYASEGPFRYLGYGGLDAPNGGEGPSYMSRRFQPAVQELLVNGRAIFLGLDDVQGYNPVELARYAALMTAINGQPQNYHLADLLPSGTASPLLDLLDVRYVIVPVSLPRNRADVAALIAGGQEVYRDRFVAVYRRVPAPVHAWIVHDVRPVAAGSAFAALNAAGFDLRTSAVVDGSVPATAPSDGTSRESAKVTRYEPETIALTVHAETAGLLVLSEIAAAGWKASVDGVPAPMLIADGALRAVPVAAGDHIVLIRYRPAALVAGMRITVTTATVLAALLAVGFANVRIPNIVRPRRLTGRPRARPATGRRWATRMPRHSLRGHNRNRPSSDSAMAQRVR